MKNTGLKQGVAQSVVGVAVAGAVLMTAMTGYAAEAWQASFEEICSKVDASGSLSEKELSTLIERADKLAPEIQASNDPSKKVYLKRLKNCRSMYEFMIDTKKSSGK